MHYAVLKIFTNAFNWLTYLKRETYLIPNKCCFLTICNPLAIKSLCEIKQEIKTNNAEKWCNFYRITL